LQIYLGPMRAITFGDSADRYQITEVAHFDSDSSENSKGLTVGES